MSKATLYIWMPKGAYTTFGVGHAALAIKTANGEEHYITWIVAGGGMAKSLFPSQSGKASPRMKPGGIYNYPMDRRTMAGWGQEAPNHQIELPTLSLDRTKGLSHGVDVERIKQFWTKRRATMTDYTFLSKKENCTGCVVEALRAGGLDQYLTNPNNWLLQDARTLLTWANAAKERIKLANERQKSIDVLMQRLTTKQGAWVIQQGESFIRTIPSLQEWKTESDQNIRFRGVARRIEQIARLDKIIDEYHRANDRDTQVACLMRMLYQVYQHLTKKPNSDRRLAVEQLGVRAYAAFWHLCREVLDDDSSESSESLLNRPVLVSSNRRGLVSSVRSVLLDE